MQILLIWKVKSTADSVHERDKYADVLICCFQEWWGTCMYMYMYTQNTRTDKCVKYENAASQIHDWFNRQQA